MLVSLGWKFPLTAIITNKEISVYDPLRENVSKNEFLKGKTDSFIVEIFVKKKLDIISSVLVGTIYFETPR